MNVSKETTIGRFRKAAKFWDIIMTRSDCLDKLRNFFEDNNQQPIVNILKTATRDDGSDQKYNFIDHLKPLEVKVVKPVDHVKHEDVIILIT